VLDRRRLILAGLGAAFAPTAARAAQGGIEARFTLTSQRVLVDARLNGKGPYPFVMDTGAVVSGVRKPLADEVGLRPAGSSRLAGQVFPMYLADEMVLGDAFRQEKVALFGLDSPRLGGEGLLAAGLLTAFDSMIEFERGVWRVYPKGSPERTGFTRLVSNIATPIRGGSERIYVNVVANGVTLRPILDTGGPNALSVSEDVGRRLGLLKEGTPWAPVVQSGITGVEDQPSRLVRADSLQIGPYSYERPLVVVRSHSRHGEEAILGLPIVRTLDFSTDRAGDAIWVRRNGLEPAKRGYGLSGLWLSEAGGAVRITAVGAGSPGGAAGVRDGDVLEGAKTIAEGVALINGPAGKMVTLDLRRDGQAVKTSYVLAEYL
jgi:serine protease Do